MFEQCSHLCRVFRVHAGGGEEGQHVLKVKRTVKYKGWQTALRRRKHCWKMPWAVGQEVAGWYGGRNGQSLLKQVTSALAMHRTCRVMRIETEIKGIVAGENVYFRSWRQCHLYIKSDDGLLSDVVASIFFFFFPQFWCWERGRLTFVVLFEWYAVKQLWISSAWEIPTWLALCSYCFGPHNANPARVWEGFSK